MAAFLKELRVPLPDPAKCSMGHLFKFIYTRVNEKVPYPCTKHETRMRAHTHAPTHTHTHTFNAGCLFLEDSVLTLLFICALPLHSPWHVFLVCPCLIHIAVGR